MVVTRNSQSSGRRGDWNVSTRLESFQKWESPQKKFLYYLDGFEFGWIIICILLQNMACWEAQRTQSMENGPIKSTKRSHVWVYVKWVTVSRQSIDCSLQRNIRVKTQWKTLKKWWFKKKSSCLFSTAWCHMYKDTSIKYKLRAEERCAQATVHTFYIHFFCYDFAYHIHHDAHSS